MGSKYEGGERSAALRKVGSFAEEGEGKEVFFASRLLDGERILLFKELAEELFGCISLEIFVLISLEIFPMLVLGEGDVREARLLFTSRFSVLKLELVLDGRLTLILQINILQKRKHKTKNKNYLSRDQFGEAIGLCSGTGGGSTKLFNIFFKKNKFKTKGVFPTS